MADKQKPDSGPDANAGGAEEVPFLTEEGSAQSEQPGSTSDLADAGRALALETGGHGGQALMRWRVAADIVRKVRPVPWLLWNIIRAVYGKSGELGEPDPLSFSPIGALILHAAADKALAAGRQGQEPPKLLAEAVGILGTDVAAAVCFVHAVSRRVSSLLSERVSRAILDDALLRTFIGYHVGQDSALFGPGRGMIAGFSGRSGLAIQVASGTPEAASKALSGLASGTEIGAVCQQVYGCDPLQVAALALISGGCNRDMAVGIAAFNTRKQEVMPGTEQYLWLCAFEVIENLRMGRHSLIPSSSWQALGFDDAGRDDLTKKVQTILRRGHSWRWLVKPLVVPGDNRRTKPETADDEEKGR